MQVFINQTPAQFASMGWTSPFDRPKESAYLGIGIIHQELEVIDTLDVAANIYLGREPQWGGPLRLVDNRTIYSDTETFLKRLGLNVSPSTLLGDLSTAQQQMVEIARALSQNARILIMDEPTSSLTLSGSCTGTNPDSSTPNWMEGIEVDSTFCWIIRLGFSVMYSASMAARKE